MVATGWPALCVATFAMLATRALKHTIYGNFGACRPRRGPNWGPNTVLLPATDPALCVTHSDLATQPALCYALRLLPYTKVWYPVREEEENFRQMSCFGNMSRDL